MTTLTIIFISVIVRIDCFLVIRKWLTSKDSLTIYFIYKLSHCQFVYKALNRGYFKSPITLLLITTERKPVLNLQLISVIPSQNITPEQY
jgi:hypothetical protein